MSTHAFTSERESDVVKKVDISKYLSMGRDENPLELPLYIVSLIEHKTKVEGAAALTAALPAAL